MIRWKSAVKRRTGNGLLTAALFQAFDTDDEIVVASSMGGRTTYKNAGKNAPRGARARVGPALRRRLAGGIVDTAGCDYRSNVCQGKTVMETGCPASRP